MAILQANPVSGERLAVLDAQITSQGDGWFQLLPVGPFMARDGRPFDMASGYWQDILIDYDHQTLKTDQNGQPAPALTPGCGVGASSLFVILGEVAAIELA
ncbi:phage protease [Aeromonas hydrophila]|uniref:phage protease n=1 Tax=Aeromonas hydrophila TaxID=644 RepID=UPI002B4A8C02|nr:phage protease [Aeromonas hydrophila]